MKIITAAVIWCWVLAGAAMLVSMPADAQQGYDCAHGPDTYRVRGVPSWDRLNVRAEPGSGSAIVGSISATASGIQCVGPCKRRWCRINWQGTVGWVNMRYLGE